MECLACKIEMLCSDDVNDINARIDWLECPKCKAEAEVIYKDGEISMFTWKKSSDD